MVHQIIAAVIDPIFLYAELTQPMVHILLA